jgi:hypothetical protein
MRLISFYVLKHNEENSLILTSTHQLDFIRFRFNLFCNFQLLQKTFLQRTSQFRSQNCSNVRIYSVNDNFRRLKRGERSFIEDKEEKDIRSFVDIQKNGLAGNKALLEE